MKVSSISAGQNYNCRRVSLYTKQNCVKNKLPESSVNKLNDVNFKSDKGAAVGILAGALVGLGAAALVVSTGGLAAAVAAVGTTGVAGAGAGLGAQVGGIIGGLATKDED